jgi:hypothetical protein
VALPRNTALHGLVQELPPTLVANALGYSYQVIHKHAADAGTPMAGYAGKGTLPAEADQNTVPDTTAGTGITGIGLRAISSVPAWLPEATFSGPQSA